jgi:hypothetical protein
VVGPISKIIIRIDEIEIYKMVELVFFLNFGQLFWFLLAETLNLDKNLYF